MEEKKKRLSLSLRAFCVLCASVPLWFKRFPCQSQPNWRVRKPLPTWRTMGEPCGQTVGLSVAPRRRRRSCIASSERGRPRRRAERQESAVRRRSRQASVPSSAPSSASASASSSSGPRSSRAGERGRQGAEQEGVAPPRLAGDADRREVRRPLGQAARVGGREGEDERFDAVFRASVSLPRLLPQMLVNDPLVRPVLVDQIEPVRPLRDDQPPLQLPDNPQRRQIALRHRRHRPFAEWRAHPAVPPSDNRSCISPPSPMREGGWGVGREREIRIVRRQRGQAAEGGAGRLRQVPHRARRRAGGALPPSRGGYSHRRSPAAR